MDTKNHKFKRLSNEIFTLVLVVGIVLALYAFVYNFLHFRWDLTSTGQFSLSPTSLKMLEKIKAQNLSVKVKAFYRPLNKTSEEELKKSKTLDLLEEYHLRSNKLISRPQVLDPDQNPGEVARYGIRNVGTVVFEMEEKNQPEGENESKRQLIYPREIWGLRIIDGKPGPAEFRAENAFTSGLKKLLENEKHEVCFVEGHQEHGFSSKEPDGCKDLASELELNNFRVQNLNLLQRKTVPENCDIVAIAGPKQIYLPSEVSLLQSYALSGGRLLLLAEFDTDNGLSPLMNNIGIELGKNLVVDVQRSFFGKPTSLIPIYGNHEIVNDLKNAGGYAVLPTVRSVERALGDTRGISTTDLLMTSPSGWGEADFRTQVGAKKDISYQEGSADIKGPVTMAMAVSKPLENVTPTLTPSPTPHVSKKTSITLGESQEHLSVPTAPISKELRAVVIGDSDFATNEHIKYGANKDLLLNITLWLAGKEDEISISPKDPVFNFVTMTKRQIWVVFGIVVVMLPSIVLAFGTYKWWQRRSL